jgi:hypothetical protein
MTLTDYEVERQRRIEENKRKLDQLCLPQVRAERPAGNRSLAGVPLFRRCNWRFYCMKHVSPMLPQWYPASAARLQTALQDVVGTTPLFPSPGASMPARLIFGASRPLIFSAQMVGDMQATSASDEAPKKRRKADKPADPLEPTRRQAAAGCCSSFGAGQLVLRAQLAGKMPAALRLRAPPVSFITMQPQPQPKRTPHPTSPRLPAPSPQTPPTAPCSINALLPLLAPRSKRTEGRERPTYVFELEREARGSRPPRDGPLVKGEPPPLMVFHDCSAAGVCWECDGPSCLCLPLGHLLQAGTERSAAAWEGASVLDVAVGAARSCAPALLRRLQPPPACPSSR